jgi:hypothetical protein
MPDNKIRISWDELHAPEVDARLKQQEALARAQEHQARQGPAPVASRRRGSLWYNSLIYMTVFGFAGGLLAWGASELTHRVSKTQSERLADLDMEAGRLIRDRKEGKITTSEFDDAMRDLEEKARKHPYVKIMNDHMSPFQERFQKLEKLKERDKTRSFINIMLFVGLCGTVLALSLSAAEPLVTRNFRGVLANGSVGAALGLIGGLIVSLFIDALYKKMLGFKDGRLAEEPSMATQMFARAVGWGILGLFLSVAPGVVLRSWKRLLIGLAGGLVGGVGGGLLFDPIAKASDSDTLSRVVALSAIGLLAGVATGLIENAAKTGWLRVTAGLIAGKQFILYRDPTSIGSSPLCEVYLFKDPRVSPRHAALHLLRGGVEIEDLGSETGTFVNGQAVTRQRLRDGD